MLYLAMWKLLVRPDGEDPTAKPEGFADGVEGSGFLDALFLYRLPAEQCHEVDVAFKPVSGIGATRAFGSREVEDITPLPGGGETAHDGGVQWYHSGIQFQLRGRDTGETGTLKVASTADQIRDMLIQVAGEPVIVRWGGEGVKGEEIVRCDISTAPRFYRQDRRERVIASLQVEAWHRPERRAA